MGAALSLLGEASYHRDQQWGSSFTMVRSWGLVFSSHLSSSTLCSGFGLSEEQGGHGRVSGRQELLWETGASVGHRSVNGTQRLNGRGWGEPHHSLRYLRATGGTDGGCKEHPGPRSSSRPWQSGRGGGVPGAVPGVRPGAPARGQGLKGSSWSGAGSGEGERTGTKVKNPKNEGEREEEEK